MSLVRDYEIVRKDEEFTKVAAKAIIEVCQRAEEDHSMLWGKLRILIEAKLKTEEEMYKALVGEK